MLFFFEAAQATVADAPAVGPRFRSFFEGDPSRGAAPAGSGPHSAFASYGPDAAQSPARENFAVFRLTAGMFSV